MEEKGCEDKRVWYGVFKCDRDVRVSNNVRVSQVQSLLPLLFVSYKIFHATNIASQLLLLLFFLFSFHFFLYFEVNLPKTGFLVHGTCFAHPV